VEKPSTEATLSTGFRNLKHYPLVSVLFVTYKRVNLLEGALSSFLRNTDYPNLELIVADDGSPLEVQAAIRKLPFDKFALPARNRGLGANNNQGMALASGKYILMIQDDRHCVGPRSYLREAITFLVANPHVGLLNFSSSSHMKDDSIQLNGDDSYWCIRLKPSESEPKRMFLYTDTPHIMTRAAFERVGPYLEHRDMEVCERDYELRWEAQKDFATAIHGTRHDEAFVNVGVAESFRAKRLRYRVETRLAPIGRRLKVLSPTLFAYLKIALRLPIRSLERLHIAR
jgi:hypothetical protein